MGEFAAQAFVGAHELLSHPLRRPRREPQDPGAVDPEARVLSAHLVADLVGRLADGWFPQVRPGPDLDRALDERRAAGTGGRYVHFKFKPEKESVSETMRAVGAALPCWNSAADSSASAASSGLSHCNSGESASRFAISEDPVTNEFRAKDISNFL